jgi:S1-C subfamily serine protease
LTLSPKQADVSSRFKMYFLNATGRLSFRRTACLSVFFVFHLALSCRESVPPAYHGSKISDEILAKNFKRSLAIFSENNDPIGSGLLIGEDGQFLTCFHVIAANNENILVRQNGKILGRPRLIKKSYEYDLALYRIDGKFSVPDIVWVNEKNLVVDEEVFVFANAYGLEDSFFRGYISHTERKIQDPVYHSIGFIQTRGIAYPGVSGAGIFLKDGRYAGVNRSSFGSFAENGLGLALPASVIIKFLK